MEDYPVMLYLGGLDSHAIAHDEDEADALKAKGYVEHDEAVKIEPKQEVTKTDDNADQLTEAYEHIELLEGAIEVKDKEIADLNGKLEDKDKIIAANHRMIDEVRADYDELYKSKNSDGVISYDEMTNAELQKLLEQRKVDYNKRDGKDALIQKLKDSE